MATPEHISTPRIAFYLTVAFAAAWLTGAHVMMDSEIDPHGYQDGDYATSVYLKQLKEQQAPAEAPAPAFVASAR